MSDRTDWLREYERYLDGEIEYKDLPPIPPAPPSPPVITSQDAKAMVDDAHNSARRTSRRFTAIAAVPIIGVSAIMYFVDAPLLLIWAVQFVTASSCIRLFKWYLARKDQSSPEKRDPTLDEVETQPTRSKEPE